MKNLERLLYVDDLAVVANSNEERQKILLQWHNIGQDVKLYKVMSRK